MAQRGVVVTGSTRGSKTAWLFLRFLLSLYRIKATFIHPKSGSIPPFDGLIITGGVDICPQTYAKNGAIPCQKERDSLELSLIDEAFSKHLPILGICRGMQLLNVYFGGTLHLDLTHLGIDNPHTPLPLKEITILPYTKLHTILNQSKIKVNSLHHQAIDRLGEGLAISAIEESGIIQGIEHKERFILGVQWHPEYLPYHPLQRKIFRAFIQNLSR